MHVMMTPKEVADWLRVSRQTLKNWRRDGTGPPWLKLENSRVLYCRADVESWLDAQGARR